MRLHSRAAALAALALAATVAASPLYQRHAVLGHFKVPRSGTLLRSSSGGGNVITNPGFESGAIDLGWYQCGDVSAYINRQHPWRGTYSEYSGTRSGRGEPIGNSGVCQRVTIPAGGVLTAHLYQLSDEPDTAYAYQEGDLLDNRGGVVINLFKSVNNSGKWTDGTWNLAAYAGKTFWLYFGVHGDGDPRFSTQQFVDEVRLAPSRE